MKPIVILGVGGLAPEIAWLIEEINHFCPSWKFVGFVDTVQSGRSEIYGYPVLGSYNQVAAQFTNLHFVCGMGDCNIRQKEAEHAESLGWRAATLIHPSVVTARFSTIGEGTTIAAGCVIGPHTAIGRHCLLSAQVFLGHNAAVGSFSAISPGARINGYAVVADRVSIGSNATVGPKCNLGSDACLGANSFLQTDLDASASAIGVPAKVFYRAHQTRHISR